MLIYHPAFDAYHCLIRMCAILMRLPKIERDRLRVLDFLLCFPTYVVNFKLPKEVAFIRSQARTLENPYRAAISAKRVFADLEVIQDASVACLVAGGLVRENSDDEVLLWINGALSQELTDRCKRIETEETFFFNAILSSVGQLPLKGPDGLKARSGLVEYRYDLA